MTDCSISSRNFTALRCAGNQIHCILLHWDFKDLQCRMQKFLEGGKQRNIVFSTENTFSPMCSLHCWHQEPQFIRIRLVPFLNDVKAKRTF